MRVLHTHRRVVPDFYRRQRAEAPVNLGGERMPTLIDLEEFAAELTRSWVAIILTEYTAEELERLIDEMEATVRRQRLN
jgi:hypothetical protein